MNIRLRKEQVYILKKQFNLSEPELMAVGLIHSPDKNIKQISGRVTGNELKEFDDLSKKRNLTRNGMFVIAIKRMISDSTYLEKIKLHYQGKNDLDEVKDRGITIHIETEIGDKFQMLCKKNDLIISNMLRAYLLYEIRKENIK